MGQKSGSFGQVSYEGNNITIEIDSNSIGSLALTSGGGRIECYWDGNEWVCQSVSFGQSQSEQAAAE